MVPAALLALAYLLVAPRAPTSRPRPSAPTSSPRTASCSGTTTGTRGHYLPGYSVALPAARGRSSALGVLGALSAVAAAGCSAALARRSVWRPRRPRDAVVRGGDGDQPPHRPHHLRARARGRAWGALGAAAPASSPRPPLLGLLTVARKPGRGAVRRLGGRRCRLRGRSPRRARRSPRGRLGAAALWLSLAFPTGASSRSRPPRSWPVPLFAAGRAHPAPREEADAALGDRRLRWRPDRRFRVPNPVGGNTARLGALCGGPCSGARPDRPPARRPGGPRGAASLLAVGGAGSRLSDGVRATRR